MNIKLSYDILMATMGLYDLNRSSKGLCNMKLIYRYQGMPMNCAIPANYFLQYIFEFCNASQRYTTGDAPMSVSYREV